MPINVACEHCATRLQVLDEHNGRQVRCPKCYQVFVAKAIPDGVAAAGAAPAAGGEPVAVSDNAPAPGAPRFCAHCGAAITVANAAFCAACGRPPAATGAPLPGVVSAPSYPQNVPAPYPTVAHTNGLATASLILGVLSFMCFSALSSIPAIICGHIARRQIAESGGMQTGGGMALAGLILGYINVGLTGLWFALVFASAMGHP